MKLLDWIRTTKFGCQNYPKNGIHQGTFQWVLLTKIINGFIFLFLILFQFSTFCQLFCWWTLMRPPNWLFSAIIAWIWSLQPKLLDRKLKRRMWVKKKNILCMINFEIETSMFSGNFRFVRRRLQLVCVWCTKNTTNPQKIRCAMWSSTQFSSHFFAKKIFHWQNWTELRHFGWKTNGLWTSTLFI